MTCFPSLPRMVLATLLLCSCVLSANAQTTGSTSDVPRTISYQGILSSNDGKPLLDGQYQITVALYSDEAGSARVWQDTYTTSVNGGLFNLYLGSGNTPLPPSIVMNTPLWIGTALNSESEMRPLTPLSASPYALNVPDGSITANKLADKSVTAAKLDADYVAGLQVNGEQVTGKGTVLNIQGTPSIPLSYDPETQSLTIGRIDAGAGDKEKGASTLGTNFDFWTMQGDGRTDNGPVVPAGPADMIGPLGAILGVGVPFNLTTFTGFVMVYQPSSTVGATDNIVGGNGNAITLPSDGSVISGGGGFGAAFSNNINGNKSAIGGGQANNIGTAAVAVPWGTIGGGMTNNITTGPMSTIGGGANNTVTAPEATIAGGHMNQVNAYVGAITGGHNANITLNGQAGFIGGGRNNTVDAPLGAIGGGRLNNIWMGSDSSFIGGGGTNTIGNAAAVTATLSVIAGGQNNRVESQYGAIGGGTTNSINTNSPFATVSGGQSNTIAPNAFMATIGGGGSNSATAPEATIAGGHINQVNAYVGTIAGGHNGNITLNGTASFIGGGRNNMSDVPLGAIGGGRFNNIWLGSDNSFIGGGDSNTIGNTLAIAADRSVIGGGLLNNVTGRYSTIGGGQLNSVSAQEGVVGGGRNNRVSGPGSTIGGGWDNNITAPEATIAGGHMNQVNAYVGAITGGHNANITLNGQAGFIGGGRNNTVDAPVSAIAGGRFNTVWIGSDSSFIGGGGTNTIGNAAAVMATLSVIAGGQNNRVESQLGSIGGGSMNSISTNSPFATVSGGQSNTIAPNAFMATIGGGGSNSATAPEATIAGGHINQVNAYVGTIAGGHNGNITLNGTASFIGGGRNNMSDVPLGAIGGGRFNNIWLGSDNSFIGGGDSNTIGNTLAIAADRSVIGGGLLNNVTGRYSTIGGGQLNSVSAQEGVVGGGRNNRVSGPGSTIGGGWDNNITAPEATIAGGHINLAESYVSAITGGHNNHIMPNGNAAFIGGGRFNITDSRSTVISGGNNNTIQLNSDFSRIGGGTDNLVANNVFYASIGGGQGNVANGSHTTMPGGDMLVTDPSYAQTVVGFFNAPRGAAVPVRSSGPVIAVTDEPLFIVGNGDGSGAIPIRSNAFEVSYNGHSTVYDINGTGTPGGRSAFKGSTYGDNVVYAWANVDPTTLPNPTADFGVASVTAGGPGVFNVTLNYLDPITGNITPSAICVTATINDPACAIIRAVVPPGATNTFTIYINDLSCNPVDLPFMFHVTGRP